MAAPGLAQAARGAGTSAPGAVVEQVVGVALPPGGVVWCSISVLGDESSFSLY